MHELGLAQDVLKKVKEEAAARGLAKVASARVKIGQSLITDPPEFKEIFADISAGTPAEGMQMELEIVPLKAVCASCGREFDSKKPRLDCPHCSSTDLRISSGKELLVQDLK
jgi:hydrogenase nickel incorporation protein HypA/HybF